MGSRGLVRSTQAFMFGLLQQTFQELVEKEPSKKALLKSTGAHVNHILKPGGHPHEDKSTWGGLPSDTAVKAPTATPVPGMTIFSHSNNGYSFKTVDNGRTVS